MAIIAPNICRYSVIGDLFGEDCVNLFDIRVTGVGGSTTNRSEALPIIGGDLLNQWSDHIVPILSAGYEAQEVRWVDLDSASGITGSTQSTDGTTWPEFGGTTGEALPNNVYVKVTKQLEGKTRQQRNGTLRLGGIPESYTTGADGNRLVSTQQAGITAAFEDLKDGINGRTDYQANLVVVHTVDDVYSGYSQIAEYIAQPVVGTLRRRMPGYGS